MSVVTIKEACWLSVDIEPSSMRKHANFGHVGGAFVEITDYYERLQVVQSALVCKELNFIPVGEKFIDGMVKLADFVEWAAKVGYEMPDELRGFLDKNQSGQIKENDKVPNMVSDTPTAAIIITQSNQADDSSIAELDKPLDPREQNTLLKIIAALCERAGIKADQDGLDKELEGITQRLRVPITARTIKNHLRKAAELVE